MRPYVEFEDAWAEFVERETRSATGKRLERLKKDLVGEKKLFSEVLWPIFQSFEGFSLEYEFKNRSGVSMFVDAFYHPLNFAFESEGYAYHAELITRERFSFERDRIRTLVWYGYHYIPFSWDELDKHPEACRRSVHELLGKYGASKERAIRELTVCERETIRYVYFLNRPFRLEDVRYCLGLQNDTSRKVIRSLMAKGMVRPAGEGRVRLKLFECTDLVKQYIWS
jgi:hypothetical protein